MKRYLTAVILGCALGFGSYVLLASSKVESPKEELHERHRLWASLGTLRPEIDRLGAGQFDSSERQRQLISLLARIVAAEMDSLRKGSTLPVIRNDKDD